MPSNGVDSSRVIPLIGVLRRNAVGNQAKRAVTAWATRKWAFFAALFEIVMRRYETRSTMMTTNRPPGPSSSIAWLKVVSMSPSSLLIKIRIA